MLVGICTYDEADNIELLLRRLRSALPAVDVLVVDDDSPDGTAAVARRLGDSQPWLEVIVRRGQRGLGGAIRCAIDHAIEQRYEFFLNLDGDLSHDPNQLQSLLDQAERCDDVDVVIGSRYVAGGAIVGWPLRRRLLSWLLNRFAALCLRLHVNDCSGSMRCYRVATLAQLPAGTLRSNSYSILEEILVRLKRRGAKFVEVPITFTDRAHGRSKLTIREATRSMLQIIRLAWS